MASRPLPWGSTRASSSTRPKDLWSSLPGRVSLPLLMALLGRPCAPSTSALNPPRHQPRQLSDQSTLSTSSGPRQISPTSVGMHSISFLQDRASAAIDHGVHVPPARNARSRGAVSIFSIQTNWRLSRYTLRWRVRFNVVTTMSVKKSERAKLPHLIIEQRNLQISS